MLCSLVSRFQSIDGKSVDGSAFFFFYSSSPMLKRVGSAVHFVIIHPPAFLDSDLHRDAVHCSAVRGISPFLSLSLLIEQLYFINCLTQPPVAKEWKQERACAIRGRYKLVDYGEPRGPIFFPLVDGTARNKTLLFDSHKAESIRWPCSTLRTAFE